MTGNKIESTGILLKQNFLPDNFGIEYVLIFPSGFVSVPLIRAQLEIERSREVRQIVNCSYIKVFVLLIIYCFSISVRIYL